MITLKQLKSKLKNDFGWENLESDDNKWFVDNLLKDTIQAIEVIHCCKSVKEKYTHTFEVDLNSEKRQKEYNKQIEQIHNAPGKTYIFDGENYIELKP